MLNKVILIGRVGQDPEVISFEDGGKLAKFSLATNESYKDKQGNKVENTEWHSVIVNGKLADIAEGYLKKGGLLYLEGKIKYREYEKDGVKKYFTEIMAFSFKMLGGKQDGNSNQPPQGDDVPF